MVQRDLVARVLVAEYMPAVAAMVSPLEEVEGFVAGGRVADGGVGIGFPVLTRGCAFDGWEVFGGGGGGDCGGFVFGDFAEGAFALGGCCGTPACGTGDVVGAVEAVGAAVKAGGRGEGGGAVGSFCGTEGGRDVHGGFGWAELAAGQWEGGVVGGMLEGQGRLVHRCVCCGVRGGQLLEAIVNRVYTVGVGWSCVRLRCCGKDCRHSESQRCVVRLSRKGGRLLRRLAFFAGVIYCKGLSV